MQMVNQTTNSIGQMQQLNNQIAINDQKLDYAAMLKRTELDNQLNKQTVIKTVASNIAEQDKHIKKHLDGVFEKPMLLNINTVRKYWHAGAGIDDPNVFDRYEHEKDELGSRAKLLDDVNKKVISELWKSQLEKQ